MSYHRFFFYLLLLLLPTQLGYHFWPEWSYVFGRRIDYLSPTVFLTDLLILLMLSNWVIAGFRKSSYLFIGAQSLTNVQHIRHGNSIPIKLIAYLFFVIFLIINILFSLNASVAFYKWIKLTEFVLVATYIVRTKPDKYTMLIVLAASALWSSTLAILQFSLAGSIGGPLWYLGERTFTIDTPGIARVPVCPVFSAGCQLVLRPYSTFPHPNALGGYLAVIFTMLVPLSSSRTISQLQ